MIFTITVDIPEGEDEEYLRSVVYDSLDVALAELSATFGVSWGIKAIVGEDSHGWRC